MLLGGEKRQCVTVQRISKEVSGRTEFWIGAKEIGDAQKGN
jgi:hypothetical protein